MRWCGSSAIAARPKGLCAPETAGLPRTRRYRADIKSLESLTAARARFSQTLPGRPELPLMLGGA